MRRSIRIYPVPGRHHAYIARDKTKERFKVGMTGNDLNVRRKAICYDEYGRRSHDKIEMMHSWRFEDFFSAFYVEQTTIELLKLLGYERRPGDWFAIDFHSIWEVIHVISDVAYHISGWETFNFCDSCNARRPSKRYGATVRKLPKGYFGHGLISSNLAPE